MSISFNPAGFKNEAFEDIQHICRNVPDDLILGKRITSNYEAVINNPRQSKNGQSRGQAFEIIVADAIYKSVGATPSWRGHLKCAKYNAEIDLVLDYGPIVHGIFLKTSFRERWKQEDRDAMLFDKQWDADLTLLREALGHPVKAFIPWALCFKEKLDQKPIEAIAHAQRISNAFAGFQAESVMSVYDQTRMNGFEQAISMSDMSYKQAISMAS